MAFSRRLWSACSSWSASARRMGPGPTAGEFQLQGAPQGLLQGRQQALAERDDAQRHPFPRALSQVRQHQVAHFRRPLGGLEGPRKPGTSRGLGVPGGHQLQVGHHRLQLVVEVVCDGAGHAGKALGLLDLTGPGLQLGPLGLHPLAWADVANHEDEPVRPALCVRDEAAVHLDAEKAAVLAQGPVFARARLLSLEHALDVGADPIPILRCHAVQDAHPQTLAGSIPEHGIGHRGDHQDAALQVGDRDVIGGGVEDGAIGLLALPEPILLLQQSCTQGRDSPVNGTSAPVFRLMSDS